jgi:hypothetical protein
MPQSLRSPARVLAVVAALAVSCALAACGGGASSATNAAASEQARERGDETKLAQFAKCLREHGVEAKTSSTGPGAGGFGIRVGGRAGSGAGPAQMEAAQRACQKYRPVPKKIDLSPQEKVQREEAVLKFAKCMRDHGIGVHASTSGGGIQIQVHGKPDSGPNPESPAFQSAQKSCQGLLPIKQPPGGPGGREPAGPGATSGGGESPGPSTSSGGESGAATGG